MRRTDVRRSEHEMKRNLEIGLFTKPSYLPPTLNFLRPAGIEGEDICLQIIVHIVHIVQMP